MNKVKLTIVETNCRCGLYKKGQTFIVDNACPPICHELWQQIYPMVYALLNGGELDYGGGKAKELFDHLYRDKEQKPPLYYRICFLICHLMILYDLKEVVELRLNAKNYREFMLEKGEISVPAIDFLAFLRKNAKRFAAPKLKTKEAIAYNAEVDAMISLLQLYQRQDTVANRLFYGPCIHWLRAKHI